QQYVDGVLPIVRKYDGEVLVAHDDVDVLEGVWNPQRTIVLKFHQNRWHPQLLGHDNAHRGNIAHHQLTGIKTCGQVGDFSHIK
ncbi:hypothetical protein C2W62_53915, partial [Candidatus Entotheonella serta]